jgi:hypothetical protein
MTSSTASPSAGALRRRPRRWWVLAAVLLLIAVTSLTAGFRSHFVPLAGPVGPQSPPPSKVHSTAVPVVPVVARSTPVALIIPAIDMQVPLSALGLNPDGTVQVPSDIQEPGWFDLGPTPGQVGSAVILGHVDSYQGPAVFFHLPTLVQGDQVHVSLPMAQPPISSSTRS